MILFETDVHYIHDYNSACLLTLVTYWVVPEKIHTPPTEEISAVRRGRGEKIASDNSKCIRTSKGGRGVNFLFPPWGWYGVFWNDPFIFETDTQSKTLITVVTWFSPKVPCQSKFFQYASPFL